MIKKKCAPVRIRQNVQQFGDPYLAELNPFTTPSRTKTTRAGPGD